MSIKLLHEQIITKTGNDHKQPQTTSKRPQITTNHQQTTTTHRKPTSKRPQTTTNGFKSLANDYKLLQTSKTATPVYQTKHLTFRFIFSHLVITRNTTILKTTPVWQISGAVAAGGGGPNSWERSNKGVNY